ncbi:MAG: hypothetical protein KY467_08455 [Gemmatimonadetes bacterium]|nr:hypothetical protein [Gemmatimonadota bacterium]
MSNREFVFEPRLFITGPFGPCPQCDQPEFGSLSISNNFHQRRCRNCWYTAGVQLPPLQKRLIYLDQMLLSNVAKELDPVWKAKTKRSDPYWLEVFDQLDRLVKLQIVVCPESPIHEEESAYDDRFEGVLRRLYTHLASGVSLDFPMAIHIRQIWEAVHAMEEGRQPDWSRITPSDVIDGGLEQWSERLLLTVNMGHWLSLADRRASRSRGHAALLAVWERWKAENGLTFEVQFERERRAVAEVAIDSFLRHLDLVNRLNTGTETLSDPLSLIPGQLAALTLQLIKELEKPGDTFDERVRRVAAVLLSEPVMQAPKNHLAALLFAGLARSAVSGKKKPPSQGTPNDVDAISAYLPYCDAMFIDDEFAQILGNGPINREIARYPTRIFSTRTRDDFLTYLRQMEADVPPQHVELVTQTYGEDWVTPFRSILEHEREKEERRRDSTATAAETPPH